MRQAEWALVDAVERRLAETYAELPHQKVAAAVQLAYARFSQCRVREFVPLLVERRAKEQLTALTVKQPAAAKVDVGVARRQAGDLVSDHRRWRLKTKPWADSRG